MRLQLSRDFFDNPVPPKVYLCTQSGTILGELDAYDLGGNFKWNSYSEIHFSVNRLRTDVITGETIVDPLWDKIEAPRTIMLSDGYGLFVIQDVSTNYSDSEVKEVSCFSFEYNLGSKYVNNFKTNTGEVDSIEVMLELERYGSDAKKDDMYKPANANLYDHNEMYFCRKYEASGDYTYEQVQISDEDAYKTHFGPNVIADDVLYVHGYANVKFYDPYDNDLSLIDIIMKYIPDWELGDVDYDLWNKERRISEDRIDIYSLFTTKIADVFECVVIFEYETEDGVLKKKVNFYAEEEDGLKEDGTTDSRYETDVFISRQNLANELNVNYSCDDIKTRLLVSGSENLDIREVNLGKNYIMNLDYYHSHKTDEQGNKIPDYEWMEQDLFEQYSKYEDAVEEYSPKYTESMQNWVKAYNAWDKLMNDVPVEGNVLLVGDEFKKLYCIYALYTPIKTYVKDTTYYIMDETGAMQQVDYELNENNFGDQTYYTMGDADTNEKALIKKLTLYHVYEDIKANKTDNILLRLKNDQSDTATIRLFNAKTTTDENGREIPDKDNPEYRINVTVMRAATGYTEELWNPDTKPDGGINLSAWIRGDVRIDHTGYGNVNMLKGFNVTHIGTMGAYLVLMKDERLKENIQDYGVRMLQEKQDIYTTIFQTQTEAMYSQEKYQCIASDEEPQHDVDAGTRWLDTHSNPAILYERTNAAIDKPFDARWNKLQLEDDAANYENYQRYIDNFDKLRTVQEVLVEKEREAQYWLDGYTVSNRIIDLENYKVKYILATDYDKDQTYYDKDGNELNPQPTSQTEIDDGNAYLEFKPNQSLEGDMQRVAMEHFGVAKELIARVSLDTNLPLYTFTTSFDADGKFYTSKPTGGYSKGDKWITGADYAPNGMEVKYIPTKYYIKGETYYVTQYNQATTYTDGIIYYDSFGNQLPQQPVNTQEVIDMEAYELSYVIANPQPESQLEVQNGDYYVVVHYLIEAKASNTGYSDDDWGEITTFAVYLKGQTPYVAYSNSRGVYQAWMDYYSNLTELESFFNEDQWKRLSPLIREDEFTDDNFLLNGLESEEERLEICQELMAAAAKELKTLSQPSLEFSMDMANILALKEFEPIVNQFALGNFIRIELRDGLVKKSRLLEVNLSFDDLSDFSCTFGNLVSGKSEIDLHAELLSQAISAGKQVATSAGEWQKSVDKSNKLEESINSGLADAALQVGRASGQAISWDEHGFFCRKYQDGSTDTYADQQIAIINNKLVFTKNNWATSEAALGEFEVDINGDGTKEKLYGLLAKAVVSGYIEGSTIKGGQLEIGGDGGIFRVNPNGSVEILSSGGQSVTSTNKLYADKFYTKIEYSDSTVFAEPNSTCELECKVFCYEEDITNQVLAQENPKAEFTWHNAKDSGWIATHKDGKPNVIIVTNEDVQRNTEITCIVNFDNTLIKEGNIDGE